MRRGKKLAIALAACLGVGLSALSGSALAQAPVKKPNIILIVSDDFGYGDMIGQSAKAGLHTFLFVFMKPRSAE